MNYVIHSSTRVQDGHEEHSKIVSSLEEAIAYINSQANPWGATAQFWLFELGKEVPIDCQNEQVQEPAPPPKYKNVYRLKRVKK